VIVRKLVKKFLDRSIAVAGLMMQTASYLMTAFVPRAWMLYPVSAITSFGVGITTPTLTGIVSRAVPETEQGVMMGTAQSVVALTRIVGPLWAGFSFDWLGPGAPYWSGAIMIAIAAVLISSSTAHSRTSSSHLQRSTANSSAASLWNARIRVYRLARKNTRWASRDHPPDPSCWSMYPCPLET